MSKCAICGKSLVGDDYTYDRPQKKLGPPAHYACAGVQRPRPRSRMMTLGEAQYGHPVEDIDDGQGGWAE